MPRHYKNWLKAYCGFAANSEAPIEFHFWTGVSTVAAVLRRKVWKDERWYKWTPNFYIIFVGPAGVVTKSTSLSIGFRLLEKVDGIHFGPDSMTWHGLAKKFESAVEYLTYTSGGKDHKLLMSPLTCSISELGTFLRPDDKGLVSFLTDVWDGKERPFRHETSSSGNIVIENAWLNVIGATTPAWMTNNFPPGLLSEGLGSRTIFIYADQKRELIAYPSRKVLPSSHSDTEAKLLEDLKHMANPKGPLVGPYELTDAAYAWGEAWYKKHHTTRGVHMASERYAGYLNRKQTHLHKLAIILAACQRDDLIIEEQDLIEAEAILAQAETSMIKVFESVGVIDEARHIAEVVAFVRAHKWLTSKQLYRFCQNVMPEKEFYRAVRLAIDGELLEVVERNGVKGVSPKVRITH